MINTIGLQKIFNFYGEKNQMVKLIEELSELTIEIAKFLNQDKRSDFDNLLSEVADVFVILLQLKSHFDIDENELIKKINYKIGRTLLRI